MSMTESKFLHQCCPPLCRSSGFEILVGPFPSKSQTLCALQLLFMVDATRRHAGHTTAAPLPAPPQPLSLTFCRRKFRHQQWHPSNESAPKCCFAVLLCSTQCSILCYGLLVVQYWQGCAADKGTCYITACVKGPSLAAESFI